MSNNFKMYIADCDLKALPAEHYSHSFSYYKSFSRAKKSIYYLSHKSFEHNVNNVQRVFIKTLGWFNSSKFIPKIKNIDYLLRISLSNFFYLKSLISANLLSISIIFHVNSSIHNIIAIQIFSMINRKCYQVVYLQSEPGRTQYIIWRLFNLFNNKKVFAASETDLQSVKYSKKIRKHIYTIPSVIDSSFFVKLNLNKNRCNKKEFVGCFIGDSRLEKGYDLITKWLPLAPDKFGFDVQIRSDYSKKQSEENILSSKMKETVACSSGNINLIFGPLQDTEYVEVLHRVDFIIIPYRKDSYARRSSGIFFEALASGIPVLITSGLAVQNEADQSGAAVFFNDGDEESFNNGLQEIASRYPELKLNALKASDYIKKIHSPDAVLDRILEVVSLEISHLR